MDRIAYASDKERAAIFEEAADKAGISAFIVEKDFWVSWVLEKIFDDQYLTGILCFKGGTSLSKAFKLIERFSEDIDLILAKRLVLNEGEDLEQSSKTKQANFNKEVEKRAVRFISATLREKIDAVLGGLCSVTADSDDGHVLHVRFPNYFGHTYINPDVKLEVGPLSLWDPNEKYPISSYVADAFPALGISAPLIPTIKPERTFWEKITILHQEHHRPVSSDMPPRYSRHYYDVYKMGRSDSGVKEQTLGDFNLLREVADFKDRCYPRRWAKFDEAREGIIRLYPEENHHAALRKDYAQMRGMIFGAAPEWDEILNYLKGLEEEIEGARPS